MKKYKLRKYLFSEKSQYFRSVVSQKSSGVDSGIIKKKSVQFCVNTYNVRTDGAEGVRPTHVQVSAVDTQQNLDVVEAVRLC